MSRPPRSSTLFPYTTLSRSAERVAGLEHHAPARFRDGHRHVPGDGARRLEVLRLRAEDAGGLPASSARRRSTRSEEHTSELQSHVNLVCRLLLEKKKTALLR